MSVRVVAPPDRSNAWEDRPRCRRIRTDVSPAAGLSASYLDSAEKHRTQLIEDVLVLTPIEVLGERILNHSPTRLGPPGDPHLVWRFGVGDRRVMLLGARDSPQPQFDRQAPKLVSGLIQGLDASGAEVGVVQALFACFLITERYGRKALDGVTILVPNGSTVGPSPSRALIEMEARGHDAVLALTPSGPGGALTITRPGSARYELDITGQSQSAIRHQATSVGAGLELAAQIPRIAALSNTVVGTTVVVTDGQFGTVGTGTSVSGQLSVDVRARSIEELARVDGAIRGLRPVVRGVALRVYGGIDLSPMDIDASAELFMLACRAARALDIATPDGSALDAVSDANITAALGIPTLDGLGAARAGRSSAELRVEAECVTGRTALLAEIIDTLARAKF